MGCHLKLSKMRLKSERISYKFYVEVISQFEVHKSRIICFHFILKKIISFVPVFVFYGLVAIRVLSNVFYIIALGIHSVFTKFEESVWILWRTIVYCNRVSTKLWGFNIFQFNLIFFQLFLLSFNLLNLEIGNIYHIVSIALIYCCNKKWNKIRSGVWNYNYQW